MRRLPKKMKITMALINSIGMPVARHAWLIAYEVRKGFPKKLVLHYTVKGKRKVVGTRYDIDNIVVARGWQNVDVVDEFYSFDYNILDDMKRQLRNVIDFDKSEL